MSKVEQAWRRIVRGCKVALVFIGRGRSRCAKKPDSVHATPLGRLCFYVLEQDIFFYFFLLNKTIVNLIFIIIRDNS